MWPNAIPVLAYDTARVLVEGLFRAPILSGPGLKAGLETIRFMPSTTGGRAHAHRVLAVRARDVPRRLAALRPRHATASSSSKGSSSPGSVTDPAGARCGVDSR